MSFLSPRFVRERDLLFVFFSPLSAISSLIPSPYLKLITENLELIPRINQLGTFPPSFAAVRYALPIQPSVTRKVK
jgi:hypothetical protein